MLESDLQEVDEEEVGYDALLESDLEVQDEYGASFGDHLAVELGLGDWFPQEADEVAIPSQTGGIWI